MGLLNNGFDSGLKLPPPLRGRRWILLDRLDGQSCRVRVMPLPEWSFAGLQRVLQFLWLIVGERPFPKAVIALNFR